MNILINEKEQRPRAGWRLLVQFILMFLIIGISTIILQSIWDNTIFLNTVIPQFVGFTASVWLAARVLDKRSFWDYGIDFNQQWKNDFFFGCLFAAVAIGVVFLVQWSMDWVVVLDYGWNLEKDTSFGVRLAGFFLAMLMVGFYEELFSRGYQILNLTEGLGYPALGQKGAVAMAVFLSSFLFGLLHLFNPNASFVSTINIILAGIVLALPYVLTGSLGLSVGLHFSWNFMMAGVFGFPVSGKQIAVTVLNIRQSGIEIWTGGDFGPEAGILGLLGMAIMMGLSLVYIKCTGRKLTADTFFIKSCQTDVKSDEQSR